jgi:citrate synthase
LHAFGVRKMAKDDGGLGVPKEYPSFLSELPTVPEYSPVSKAIGKSDDPEIVSALRLFASMPPSTGVLANPVRYHHSITCNGTPMELGIRSFGIRGCLLEDEIVDGTAETIGVIFVGLFGRFPRTGERKSLLLLLSREFDQVVTRILPCLAKFAKSFPAVRPDVSMQYVSVIRKAEKRGGAVNPSRRSEDLLRDLIVVHLENAAACACASYMRYLLSRSPTLSALALARRTKLFLDSAAKDDPFRAIFSLLLRRTVNATEAGILETLGAIQVHHGSAGSNMVARYLASLHTRSSSDLFVASQMALDCARHFGAITDLTDFVSVLEHASPGQRDKLIRERMRHGNLPGFGHPEIAVAGRNNRVEFDPRPAIYLSPVFKAIDAGRLKLSEERMKRVALAQRMYQLAFVEGIEKPGRSGRLRVAPNTDFGAWIVQEALGIDELDRTVLSYVFRGFGWMMDVREQLQQPIIRPVIPPDPSIAPPPAAEGVIPTVVDVFHRRLCGANAFTSR